MRVPVSTNLISLDTVKKYYLGNVPVVVICDACGHGVGPWNVMCFTFFTVICIHIIQIRTKNNKLGNKMAGDRRFKTQKTEILRE